MGSTTAEQQLSSAETDSPAPAAPANQQQQLQPIEEQQPVSPTASNDIEHIEDDVSESSSKPTVRELRQLLHQRDQEIRALRYELDKYKLALHQSQLDYHYIQRQQQQEQQDDSQVGQQVDALLADTDHLAIAADVELQQLVEPTDDEADDILVVESATDSPRVLFKTGGITTTDDDEDDEDDNEHDHAQAEQQVVNSRDHELTDMIQDVADIELSGLDFQRRPDSKRRKRQVTSEEPAEQDDDDDDHHIEQVEPDDDEDIISDGLLTSLTDAAISNLSQLAALQERCESQQQQHSHHHQQPPYQRRQQRNQHHHLSSAAPAATNDSPTSSHSYAHDPFSAASSAAGSHLASQAAIAISAAAVAAAAAANTTTQQQSSPLVVHSQAPQVPSSSASSSILVSHHQHLHHDSTIQQADLSSSNSLASVVAAAAAAAAAAASNEHHHHPHHQHHHHQQQPSNQHLASQSARLIASALPSPELYHSLQQHQQQQHSPVSSLHFSPSTSVAPSPMGAQSRRSAVSNTSSSLAMSPIASPSYLRRQFMGPDRLPLMSPSPTSGLGTTCSSSGASSSLAHLLHHQQRSASALAGPIQLVANQPSSSSTPLSSTGSATAISPLMSNKNSSQARLNNMQIRHKFGYLGSGRAQFNSPHGFCLGLNQEIVVADTNNHRVCIFDKSGTYITQFGSPGKEEGQLWNPRKVAILHRTTTTTTSSSSASAAASSAANTLPASAAAVAASSALANSSNTSSTSLHPSHLHLNPQQQQHHHHHQQQHLNQAVSSLSSTSTSNLPYSTGGGGGCSSGASNTTTTTTNSEPLYVVCDRGAERSRMQLFTKDGAFIKKIGIHYIDIVAGLAITQNGLIIVVDSVSPTVYIINGETGILNGWFDCSGYMKEPSDIAVKSDVPGNEYFICDFKGHCVVVFSEQGEYLRKIGHDGLTSYPNGIDISDDGDILVGDSHGNRFHVVVFDRNGNFVSQFECPHVKVSRCCGLKITREGYIVTLAKNNHHVLVLDTIHI